MRALSFLMLFLSVPVLETSAQDRVARETFDFGGRLRTYFLYVPDSVKADTPAPLLIVLHGSGRDGTTIVNPWKDLARKEGIIVVGPNSTDRGFWNLRNDGPDFFEALVKEVGGRRSIDGRRMYVFGHSAGGIQAMMIGLLESEYFASVAAHAGALAKDAWVLIDSAERKIPIGMWVGSIDNLFPVETVKLTKEALEAKGIPVQLRIINHHDHNYYQRSGEVNKEAWAFLTQHKLDKDPKFTKYESR